MGLAASTMPVGVGLSMRLIGRGIDVDRGRTTDPLVRGFRVTCIG